jgi:lipopolysaccharide/colanic/teichoic acid biosynthesis glycosyltransferase
LLKKLAALVRRSLDVVLSTIGLVVLAIPCAVIALAIKLDSPGPVLFHQTRVGRSGRPFTLYKFRSMHVNAGKRPEFVPAIADFGSFCFHRSGPDPRVTRVGRFLRASSLDEVPQLYNVLLGHMSLVGPRPELPEIVAQYPPEYHQRHEVRPGITGLAQISGRSTLTYHQIMLYDLDYVRRQSLWRDLGILLRTVGVVLTGKGAR